MSDQPERYFRFDVEPLDAVIGEHGPSCEADDCDGPAGYRIACEQQGDRADYLACVEHVAGLSNRALCDVDSSVRVRFDGSTTVGQR